MSVQTCPGCRSRVVVPPHITLKWVTCPGCLGRLLNPGARPATASAADRPATAPERICSVCAEETSRHDTFCPLAPELVEITSGPESSLVMSAEDDVRDSSRSSTYSLGFVGSVGAIGLLLLSLTSPIFMIFGLALLLVVVAGSIMTITGSEDRSGRSTALAPANMTFITMILRGTGYLVLTGAAFMGVALLVLFISCGSKIF